MTFLSHDASGVLCGRMTASGQSPEVMLDVPPGGMVTASSVTDAPAQRIFTWTDVHPGDDLIFPSSLRHGLYSRHVTTSITFAALPGAIEGYNVMLQCDFGSITNAFIQPGTSSVAIDCTEDARDVVVHLMTRTSAGYYFAASPLTPIAAKGPTTLAVSDWAPARLTPSTIHGDLSAFQQVSVKFQPTPPASNGVLGLFAQFEDEPSSDPTVLPATALPDEPTHISVTLNTPYTKGRGIERLYASPPASLDVTLETDFLPNVDAMFHPDPHRPEVSWTADRPIDNADIVLAQLNINDRARWSIEVAGTASSVRFPELPADVLATAPGSLFGLSIVESSDIEGWDAIRENPNEVWNTPNYRVTSHGVFYAGTY